MGGQLCLCVYSARDSGNDNRGATVELIVSLFLDFDTLTLLSELEKL